MKKVAILQSNYIPWKGYFDIIAQVDEFIFYDEVQYTKNDWRNRNKIKVEGKVKWLSIPIATAGHLSTNRSIKDTIICNNKWAKSHFTTLYHAYKKAPYFKKYKDIFANLYEECAKEQYLCKINYAFIKTINSLLDIETNISYSTDYTLIEGKSERLVNLVHQANGTEYISGPSAKNYIDEQLFKDNNIKLTWADYTNYPEYPQFYPPFEHGVSILDLIFHCGKDARKHMKF